MMCAGRHAAVRDVAVKRGSYGLRTPRSNMQVLAARSRFFCIS
jgi:hypothetical protein